MPQNEQPLVTPKDITPPVYSLEERASLNHLMQILNAARDQRDRPHPELDGMTYVEYYDSNKRKDLSYIPPKKNKGDIRIVTGHTRQKDTTLLSTYLNMNLAPDITAFDTDDLIINELGQNIGDLVTKSRQIEFYDKKRPIIYRELITQGDVFAQEILVDDFRYMPLTTLDWDPSKDGFSDFSFQERLKKVFSGCAVRMINGKKIYMGNIRTEYIEDQDTVAVMNIYSRIEAFSRYGTWERWKNIPKTIDTTQFFALDGVTYKSWNLVRLANEDQVAEVMVFQPKRNRFQILLNGIPMLPHNYPFTGLFPSGELPIAQGKHEPISDFCYSKGQPSNIKIDQEVLDETTKLMVEGMRQGRKPSLGSKNNKIISPNVFRAGHIEPDLREGDLFPIIPNAGLQAADFSFYQLIKQGIEDKTVNKSYEGDSQGVDTLGQAQIDKEQQMLKLGSGIDGLVNLERRMVWNRLYNILVNYTQPTDHTIDDVRGGIKKAFRSFSVQTTVEDGQKGVKIFRFSPKSDYPSLSDHHKEEDTLTKKHGQPVRIVYLDPEELRELKFSWFVSIKPAPRSEDKLTQVMFVQHVREAMELFGPDALQLEYVKQRYAITIDENYEKFFKKVDVMDLIKQQAAAAQTPAANPNAPATSAAGGGVQKPKRPGQPLAPATGPVGM
jgi:hypothetical protein